MLIPEEAFLGNRIKVFTQGTTVSEVTVSILHEKDINNAMALSRTPITRL